MPEKPGKSLSYQNRSCFRKVSQATALLAINSVRFARLALYLRPQGRVRAASMGISPDTAPSDYRNLPASIQKVERLA
jgi:hypothetical protein